MDVPQEGVMQSLSLKTPPRTLVLHLKRFDFNLDTMLREKLNDQFDFPSTLSLKEFSSQQLHQAVVCDRRVSAGHFT
jgi:hypothetical protein